MERAEHSGHSPDSEEDEDYPEHWGHLLSSKDDPGMNFNHYADWSVQDVVDTFSYLEYNKKEYPLR